MRSLLAFRLLVAASLLALPAALAAQTAAHFAGSITELSPGYNFLAPKGVAVDAKGDVFVADPVEPGVYEIEAVGGVVNAGSTVIQLGTFPFSSPQGVAVDASGDVYVADPSTVYGVYEIEADVNGLVSSTSAVIPVGSGFTNPQGVAVDASGNVFVADPGSDEVWEILATSGHVNAGSTVNSIGHYGFSSPQGVAVDASGNVFVADNGSDLVTEISPVSGVYPTPSAPLQVSNIFINPEGVAVDASGNVFVADSASSDVYEVVAIDGVVNSSSTTYIVGAGFLGPYGVAVDRRGIVYVGNTGDQLVIQLQPESVNFGALPIGTVSPAIQTLTFLFDAPGMIDAPAVLTQGAASLDFTDAGTGTCTTNGTSYAYSQGDTCTIDVNFAPTAPGLRQGAVSLSSAGVAIATGYVYGTGVAPQATFPPGIASPIGSGFSFPGGVAVDGAGDVFVADTSNNAVKEIVAVGGVVSTSTPIQIGAFSTPSGVAVDGAGDVFVTDYNSNTHIGAVNEIVAVNGTVSSSSAVITVGSGFNSPYGVAVDSAGDVFVADSLGYAVYEIVAVNGVVSSSSVVKTVGSNFNNPTSVAVDSAGDVFVADVGNNAVKEIVAVNGVVSSSSVVNPIGHGFSYAYGVGVDSIGDVFVADQGNSLVKEIVAAGGLVSTSSTVVTLGSGFLYPVGIAVNGSGNVFVADSYNNAVKEIDLADPPSVTFAITAVGSLSSDSPRTVTLSNSGNATLTFEAATTISTGFTLGSTTCGATLAAGASCTDLISFTPAATGTITGSLVTTDNALNVLSPYVTQTDALSGTGVAPPTLTAITPTFGPAAGGTSVALTGTGFTNTTAVTFGATAATSFVVNSDISITAIAPAHAAGLVDVTVTSAGATTATSGADQFTYIPAPVVTAVSPATGNAAGGTSVTITGTNLSPATGVSFGGVAAAIVSNTAIQIVATSPSIPAGTVDVTVTTAGGTSATSAADTFRYTLSEPVATASPSLTATLTFTTADTVASIAVLTRGIPGLDFQVAAGGTCTTAAYTAGQTCTIHYTFTPTRPGGRYGAVVLSNSSGVPLATAYLSGTGSGPQVTFPPGTISTVGSGFSFPGGLAVDDAGDIFVADAAPGSVQEIVASNGVVSSSSTVTAIATAFSFGNPDYVAVDGAGNVFVADSGAAQVYEIVAANGTVSASSAVNTIASGFPFSNPKSLAVDGAGNVFVADTGVPAVYEIVAVNGVVSSSSTVNPIGAAFLRPYGVAVDNTGDVFVADFGAGAVDEIVAVNGVVSSSSTVNPVGGGFSHPYSMAIDNSGSVFVADFGNGTTGGVDKIVAVNGAVSSGSTVVTLQSGLNYLAGMAVDSNGNAFTLDNFDGLVYEIDLVDAPSLSFANTVTGSTSSDSPKTVTVTNNGDTLLTFEAPGAASAGFTLGGGSTCATTLAAGASCTDLVSFTPPMLGLITGSLVTTDNALNAAGPAYATQTVPLSGTGVLPAPAVTAVTPPSGTAAGGTSVTITGTNLSGATGVSFGAIAAAIVSNTSTQIVTTSPSAPAATVDVTVTTGGGTSATSAADEFQYTLSEPVATASPSLTATLTLTASDTVASIAVLTQGIPGLDFQVAAGGTCTTAAYTAGQTCTVNYTFTPIRPGARYGAVVLYNSSGVALATAYLSGIGAGPQAIFPPGALGTIGSGFNHPSGVAVDSAGDVFVADYQNSAVKEIVAANGAVSSSSPVNTVGSGFNQPEGVAVDGAGDVFVADFQNSVVKEIVAINGAVSASSTVNTIGSGFVYPTGVAVDGAGNVFVTDDDNTVVKEIVAANGVLSSSSTVNTIASGFVYPADLAVDASGNVFVADFLGNAVYEIVAVNGAVSSSSVVNPVGSGFSQPFGVAVDSSGNVFVADSQNNAVKEIVAVNGAVSSSSTVISLGSGFSDPGGVAVDSRGNVFVGDQANNAVKEIDFVDPPSLSFASTEVGLTSSDSPQTVTVTNDGNAALIFEAPGAASAGFTLGGSSTCAATLASGASCTEIVSFTPATAGNIAGSLVTTDNALNAPSPYATQTIPLSGIATPTLTAATSVPTTMLTVNHVAAAFTPVTGSGGAAPLTYTVSPALPAGLSFASATGMVSGVPTAAGAATTYIVTVTDALGAMATANFSLSVSPAVVATVVIPSTLLTQGHAAPFTPVTGSGGSAPLSYSVSPALPAGLSLSSATGVVSGTSTGVSAATTYAVTVTDANGATATANFSLTVNAAVAATAVIPVEGLTQGRPASFTPVTGSGGTGTLTYSISTPLPAGLSFSPSTGMVSGTPTAAGAATTYTVTVTDANGATTTASFSLTVNGPVAATVVVPSTLLTQGHAASFTPVTGSGGTGTLTYSLSAALPAGLIFSSATGIVSGTPTAVSAATTYTVTVTDSNGAATTASFTLTVYGALAATVVIPSELLTQGEASSFTPVTGSGGKAPLIYSVSPALPSGLSFASSTGAVSGTPTVIGAAATYTVTVTDSDGASATASFMLIVNSPVAATATSLSANPTTQLADNPVVLTAQVTSATAGTFTGTVNFLDGTALIAAAPVGANGQATYADSALSAGLHSLTAAYSGDTHFLPSSSAALPLAITVASINLVLTGDQSETVVPGFPVTYNLSLAPLVTTTFLYDVHLTATGLPPGATYTFTPSTIPAGSGPVPVAFAVQTAKTTGMLGSSRRAWFGLVFGLLLPLAGTKRFRARLLLGALTLSLVAGLGGCGSGGFFGAPKGQSSYTITIVATSGTLVRTTTVQLNLE